VHELLAGGARACTTTEANILAQAVAAHWELRSITVVPAKTRSTSVLHLLIMVGKE
jgi:hypothetical protein